MPDPIYTDADRRNTLLILRIIWLAMVMGQLMFGLVLLFQIVRSSGGGGQQQLQGQMLAIAAGVLVGAVGLGYFVRNQSYKKHWRGHAVTPAGFFQGNLILFALLEVASFVTLLLVMLSGQIVPLVLPAVASLAILCANYPSGTPMQETLPDLSRGAS